LITFVIDVSEKTNYFGKLANHKFMLSLFQSILYSDQSA